MFDGFRVWVRVSGSRIQGSGLLQGVELSRLLAALAPERKALGSAKSLDGKTALMYLPGRHG